MCTEGLWFVGCIHTGTGFVVRGTLWNVVEQGLQWNIPYVESRMECYVLTALVN
jgi:hypothetical protein